MKRRDEKIKRAPQKQEDVVEQSLRAIYQVEGGEMPDLSKLERQHSHRWVWVSLLVTGILMALSTAAWAGFWYFQGSFGLGDKGLDMAIEGPEQISIGQEVTYFVNYRNSLNEPMSNADVRVNFPTDFIMAQSQPAPTDKSLWKLGSLAAEQSGTITVRGKFMGALGTVSAIQAMATFHRNNGTEDLESIASANVIYSQTVLEGWIQVPEKAVPGDNVALIYHVKNNGREDISGLESRMQLPDGFSLDANSLSVGQVESRVYKKNLPVLAAGSSTEISLVGTFASGYGGDAKVMGQIGTLGQGGDFKAALKSETVFPVLAGDLSLKLVVNGSDAIERGVMFGDKLMAAVGYENTSDEALKNVKLQMAVETVALDGGKEVLDKVQIVDLPTAVKGTSSTQDGNRLVWDSKNFQSFKEVASHAQGSLEVTLDLSSQATGTRPMAVRLTVTAEMEVGKTKRSVQMTPMVFKLRSDAKFSSQARYYTEEGAPLGSGPLPPKIGQPTIYRIIWSLDKRIHNLKDLEATAILPRSVRFVSLATSTAGALAYDADKREVKWTLNKLPANANSAEVEFDIELTPILADDGRFAQLLGETTFAAQDEDLAEPILQTTKALTTDLKNDETANGKGVVRKDVK